MNCKNPVTSAAQSVVSSALSGNRGGVSALLRLCDYAQHQAVRAAARAGLTDARGEREKCAGMYPPCSPARFMGDLPARLSTVAFWTAGWIKCPQTPSVCAVEGGNHKVSAPQFHYVDGSRPGVVSSPSLRPCWLLILCKTHRRAKSDPRNCVM